MQMPELDAKEKMREGLRNWRGGEEEDFIVVRHPERGRCVITAHDIPNDTFVLEYEGQFMRRDTADQLDKLYNAEGYGSYIIDATWNNKKVSIDGTQAYGTIGRLVNHAGVGPNLKAYGLLDVEPNQFPRLALYSTRAIQKGEELFWNYGSHVEKFPWAKFPCPREPFKDLKSAPVESWKFRISLPDHQDLLSASTVDESVSGRHTRYRRRCDMTAPATPPPSFPPPAAAAGVSAHGMAPSEIQEEEEEEEDEEENADGCWAAGARRRLKEEDEEYEEDEKDEEDEEDEKDEEENADGCCAAGARQPSKWTNEPLVTEGFSLDTPNAPKVSQSVSRHTTANALSREVTVFEGDSPSPAATTSTTAPSTNPAVVVPALSNNGRPSQALPASDKEGKRRACNQDGQDSPLRLKLRKTSEAAAAGKDGEVHGTGQTGCTADRGPTKTSAAAAAGMDGEVHGTGQTGCTTDRGPTKTSAAAAAGKDGEVHGTAQTGCTADRGPTAQQTDHTVSAHDKGDVVQVMQPVNFSSSTDTQELISGLIQRIEEKESYSGKKTERGLFTNKDVKSVSWRTFCKLFYHEHPGFVVHCCSSFYNIASSFNSHIDLHHIKLKRIAAIGKTCKK